VGDEGAEGRKRQARHRGGLYERAERRGVRAAGGDGAAVRLCHQQRAPDAAVRHRPAIRPGEPARRDRQELLLPDRRRREPFLRGQELQPVHLRGRD
jgi:hypothetical protein